MAGRLKTREDVMPGRAQHDPPTKRGPWQLFRQLSWKANFRIRMSYRTGSWEGRDRGNELPGEKSATAFTVTELLGPDIGTGRSQPSRCLSAQTLCLPTPR